MTGRPPPAWFNETLTQWADTLAMFMRATTWRTLANDVDGRVIGVPQYDRWKANYGTIAGWGRGFSANLVVAEPMSAVLLLVTAAGRASARSGKHRIRGDER
jgi:hypothetical protein